MTMATTKRTIQRVIPAPAAHQVGDGFRVLGYFSAAPDLQRALSPFLLLDYHPPFDYPATTNLRRGVGPHPHRGFETVSIAFSGSVAHHDSTGAGGVIGPGDVQWMTAASGILHREYHEASFARAGGTMHFAQIWVNLPRAHKMSAPGYQPLTAADIGRVELPDGAGIVRVIAGEHAGKKGPARTFTPVTMLDAKLAAGATTRFVLPARHNAALLVMTGELRFSDGRTAGSEALVLLAHDGDTLEVTADEAAHFLVLAGEPIDEPIAAYGPFVMNSPREIEEAIRDFRIGRFGELAE
jgi:quercetin 2,3-dioxygenase